MFKKRPTPYQRRMDVERCIDAFGLRLFEEAQRMTRGNKTLAEFVWIETLVAVYRRRFALGKEGYAKFEKILRRVSGAHETAGTASQSQPAQGAECSKETAWQTSTDETSLSVELKMKASQVLWAAEAMLLAERQHRSTEWMTIGTVVIVLSALAAIGYGMSERFGNRWWSPDSPPLQSRVVTLPAPLQNLPVNTLAQVASTRAKDIDFTHLAVQGGFIYNPNLSYTGGRWPALSLAVYSLNDLNESLHWLPLKTYHLNLLPPINGQTSSTQTDVWTVSDWHLDVTGAYAILTMHWLQNKGSGRRITQLYGLNLPTGTFGLMRTLVPQESVATEYVTAVGDGRVVVQAGLNSQDGGGAVGSPVEVYSLTGTDPSHALQQIAQLSGSFGLMESPTVTTSGILFQGMVGKQHVQMVGNEIWYRLGWSGDLEKLIGPPADGQPHYGIQGLSGGLWWLETTPTQDAATGKDYQVLMSPITNPLDKPVAALTLSGKVQFLVVTGRVLIWEQRALSTSQYVLAEVQ